MLSKVYLNLLLLIIIIERYLGPLDKLNNSFHLNIAILSGRDHFDKRLTIRNTWRKNIQLANEICLEKNIPLKITANFVLGSKSCSINPIDRKSIYDCNSKYPIDIHSFKENFSLFTYSDQNGSNYYFFQGFSFKLYHSIVIHSIGINSKILDHLNIVKVQILDGPSKIKLYEADISKYNQLIDNIYQKDVNISLNAGSILILIIDHPDIKSIISQYDQKSIISKTNISDCILEILRSYSGFNDHESIPFKNGHLYYINFQFKLKDVDDIENNFKRINSTNRIWQQKIDNLNRLLLDESETYKDLFFVDILDVYRNLPKKFLFYLKNFVGPNKEITHLLKTDDDCFLNIFNIVQLLKFNLEKKFTWFGNFRKLWPINYYGKWTDNDYTSPIYPMFACGSGYILTRDIIDWIIDNYQHLFCYQGEDVSLGIWLSSINPDKIENNGWICGNEDNIDWKNLLSIPQMDNETMFQLMINN